MNIPREEKKAEAIERMQQIGIYPEVIRAFKENDIVMTSEGPLAGCYDLPPELAEEVKKFEDHYDALVYHVIRGTYNVGGDKLTMSSFLYVCDEREEWQLDRDDLKYNHTVAYVYNETWPDCSEPGGIEFKLGPAAGLIRTQ